nr:cupin domain-containing protein [Luteimonas saliphila]
MILRAAISAGSSSVTQAAVRSRRRGPWRGSIEGVALGGAVTVLAYGTDTPGAGPRLHVHPYDETFIVIEGRARFFVGEATIDVAAGEVVLGPAGVPHRFENLGPGRLQTIDIHHSPCWIQTDLDWMARWFHAEIRRGRPGGRLGDCVPGCAALIRATGLDPDRSGLDWHRVEKGARDDVRTARRGTTGRKLRAVRRASAAGIRAGGVGYPGRGVCLALRAAPHASSPSLNPKTGRLSWRKSRSPERTKPSFS